jgi:hypothetical protein
VTTLAVKMTSAARSLRRREIIGGGGAMRPGSSERGGKFNISP